MALGNSKPKSGGYGYNNIKKMFVIADQVNKELGLALGSEAGAKVAMGEMTIAQAKEKYCK